MLRCAGLNPFVDTSVQSKLPNLRDAILEKSPGHIECFLRSYWLYRADHNVHEDLRLVGANRVNVVDSALAVEHLASL